MQILVDADAFPKDIQEIVFRAVERVRIPMILVSNKRVKHPHSELISRIMVGEGPDVADDKIVELVQDGDLVITADIPLASRVIDKGAFAIDPRGELYTKSNVKHRLAMRDLMKELRQEGEITGGPSAFSRRNVQSFANEFDKFLTKHIFKRV
ncbi:MAG: hypothetical protein A2X48_04780 [Lentisphaerae bacterium GWF2_49_21]|nr:MAG: hypothetical protein A2X48_04780 [Lentisphaerae bacterium GWF2_49_21]